MKSLSFGLTASLLGIGLLFAQNAPQAQAPVDGKVTPPSTGVREVTVKPPDALNEGPTTLDKNGSPVTEGVKPNPMAILIDPALLQKIREESEMKKYRSAPDSITPRDTAINLEASQLREGLSEQLSSGLEVPVDALDFIPPSLRESVLGHVNAIVNFAKENNTSGLDQYLTANKDKLAQVFDQLGIQPTAEGILAQQKATPIQGPKGEQQKLKTGPAYPGLPVDKKEYINKLPIEPWEKDYRLKFDDLRSNLSAELAGAGQDQAKVEALMDRYYSDLEAINEYFRDQSRQAILDARATPTVDGARPEPK